MTRRAEREWTAPEACCSRRPPVVVVHGVGSARDLGNVLDLHLEILRLAGPISRAGVSPGAPPAAE